MTTNIKQKELLLVEILRTANKLNHPIDEIMKTFDITQSQYNILRILRGVYPDYITAGVLKSRMVNPRSDATRMTDKLVERELVERVINPDNRRQINVKINSQGLELLNNIEPVLNKFLQEFSPLLDDDNHLDVFKNYLEKVKIKAEEIISNQ